MISQLHYVNIYAAAGAFDLGKEDHALHGGHGCAEPARFLTWACSLGAMTENRKKRQGGTVGFLSGVALSFEMFGGW